MERGKAQIRYEEEEEEPLHIEGEGSVTDSTAAMCLLGKLWTVRPFNMHAMIETMKKLWSPSKGMICRELGSNLVSFQFNAKRDMDRITSMEPWSFNKHILVLTPLASDIQPSLMKFDKSPCWIRLYDIPVMARERNVLKQIGNRFGEFIEMDETTLSGIGRSVRLKVMLNLNNPLKRGTKIRMGSAEL